MEFSEVMVDFD